MSSLMMREAWHRGMDQIEKNHDLRQDLRHRYSRDLLCCATSLSVKELILYGEEKYLSIDEERVFFRLIDAFCEGEPLQYLLGEVDFFDISLKVTQDVLIPRPETEQLCDILVHDIFDDSVPADILDIGTGSGAIAIALLNCWTGSHCVATDISEKALEVAKINGEANGCLDRISFLQADIWSKRGKRFDLIVSNPPYISSNDMTHLPDNVVQYEPRLALLGGEDGYDFYRKIFKKASFFLKEDGLIALEIGENQAQFLKELAKVYGYKNPLIRRDLQKKDRFLFLENPCSKREDS